MKVLFTLSFSRKTILRNIENYSENVKTKDPQFESSISKLGISKGPEFSRINKLYTSAILFRNNKKLVKLLVKNFFATPLILVVIISPILTTSLFMHLTLEFWEYARDYSLIYLCTFFGGLFIANFTINCIEFIQNFEVKIGKAITRFMIFSFLVGQSTIFFYIQNMPDNLIKAILISIYSVLVLLLTIKLIFYFFSEVLVDAFYFSKKLQITEALIIESSYKLSKSNWKQIVKLRPERQDSLIQIERLARLIESDWNNHFLSGDEKTTIWKNKKLQSISDGIRSHKQELIIPSEKSDIVLSEAFKSVFEKIIKNNFQGLICAEGTKLNTNKKSIIRSLQSFLVAIIPLSVAVLLKIFPINSINENYIHIGLGLACLWFLLSLLLWLDPNLSDKIATAKSLTSVFKNEPQD